MLGAKSRCGLVILASTSLTLIRAKWGALRLSRITGDGIEHERSEQVCALASRLLSAAMSPPTVAFRASACATLHAVASARAIAVTKERQRSLAA